MKRQGAAGVILSAIFTIALLAAIGGAPYAVNSHPDEEASVVLLSYINETFGAVLMVISSICALCFAIAAARTKIQRYWKLFIFFSVLAGGTFIIRTFLTPMWFNDATLTVQQ